MVLGTLFKFPRLWSLLAVLVSTSVCVLEPALAETDGLFGASGLKDFATTNTEKSNFWCTQTALLSALVVSRRCAMELQVLIVESTCKSIRGCVVRCYRVTQCIKIVYTFGFQW